VSANESERQPPPTGDAWSGKSTQGGGGVGRPEGVRHLFYELCQRGNMRRIANFRSCFGSLEGVNRVMLLTSGKTVYRCRGLYNFIISTTMKSEPYCSTRCCWPLAGARKIASFPRCSTSSSFRKQYTGCVGHLYMGQQITHTRRTKTFEMQSRWFL